MEEIIYRFVKPWYESTHIGWWNNSRKELNKIIVMYNDWQKNGFKDDEVQKLLAEIEYGKQTIGREGECYWDELDEMEQFVKSKIKE